MKKNSIICKIEDKIAILQIDNPPANVLSTQVIKEMNNTLDIISEKDDVKAIIITGKGKCFCTGADIREIEKINSTKKAKDFSLVGHNLIKKILNFRKPIIAAINNVCLGGGLELAIACHIRIATNNTKLGLPEIKFGIMPGFGGIRILPDIIGTGKAIEMILTGEKVLAKNMKEFGLINHIVPKGDLIKEAIKIARKITQNGLITISSVLESTMDKRVKYFDEGLELETSIFEKIYETDDWRERVSSFLGKHKSVLRMD